MSPRDEEHFYVRFSILPLFALLTYPVRRARQRFQPFLTTKIKIKVNEDKRTQIGSKFKPRAGLKTVRMSVLGTVRNGLRLTATNAVVKGHMAPIVIGKIIGVCKVWFPDFFPSAISPSQIFWKTFLYRTNAHLNFYPSWIFTHCVLPIRKKPYLDWYPSQFYPSICGFLPITFLSIIE